MDHLKPYDDFQDWKKTEENELEPTWACGPILPSSLVDLLETTIQEVENQNEREDEAEIDYDEIFEDDNWI